MKKYKVKAFFKAIIKNHRSISVFFLVAVMAITIFCNKTGHAAVSNVESSVNSTVKSSTENNNNPDSADETAMVAQTGEMRAVWVPYMTLSMPQGSTEQDFTDKFSKIVKNCVDKGMNALIVQVRPFSDALYKSDYYPWSHILTGTQGQDPGYDPMQIMIDLCHKSNVQFHAWVNPLRISTGTVPQSFSADSPYTVWNSSEDTKDYIMNYNGALYMDPAYDKVREYIINGISEIVSKYKVDGVQFDDYFYPANSDGIDKKAYDTYVSNVSSPLSLHDFRAANINTLVAGVYSAIKKINSNVVFGIAPQGNFENDYSYSADVNSWGSIPGYVDYLCPQMYVTLDNKALPFEATLTQWRNVVSGKNIKLYVGLAVYKAGSDADNGAWKGHDDIISTEVSVGRNIKCDGYMFYSYDYLMSDAAADEVQNVIALLK